MCTEVSHLLACAGASLVAILSAEAHMLLNDMRFSWSLRSSLDRIILAAALAITAVLFMLICGEMCALPVCPGLCACSPSISKHSLSFELLISLPFEIACALNPKLALSSSSPSEKGTCMEPRV